MQVHLAKTDITTMPVDAVVNPANSLGIMGGGVAGALSRTGGPVHPARGDVAGADRRRRGGGDERRATSGEAGHSCAHDGRARHQGGRRERPARDARGVAGRRPPRLRPGRHPRHGHRPRRASTRRMPPAPSSTSCAPTASPSRRRSTWSTSTTRSCSVSKKRSRSRAASFPSRALVLDSFVTRH